MSKFILILCLLFSSVDLIAEMKFLKNNELLGHIEKANDGDGDAAYDLFFYYSTRVLDPSKAKYWLTKSYELGSSSALEPYIGLLIRDNKSELAMTILKHKLKDGYAENMQIMKLLSEHSADNAEKERFLSRLAFLGDGISISELIFFYPECSKEKYLWLNVYLKLFNSGTAAYSKHSSSFKKYSECSVNLLGVNDKINYYLEVIEINREKEIEI